MASTVVAGLSIPLDRRDRCLVLGPGAEASLLALDLAVLASGPVLDPLCLLFSPLWFVLLLPLLLSALLLLPPPPSVRTSSKTVEDGELMRSVTLTQLRRMQQDLKKNDDTFYDEPRVKPNFLEFLLSHLFGYFLTTCS